MKQNNKSIHAIFHLASGDTVSVEGVSIAHIYFELQSRFPEPPKFQYVEFIGYNNSEKESYAKMFLQLCKKFGA